MYKWNGINPCSVFALLNMNLNWPAFLKYAILVIDDTYVNFYNESQNTH